MCYGVYPSSRAWVLRPSSATKLGNGGGRHFKAHWFWRPTRFPLILPSATSLYRWTCAVFQETFRRRATISVVTGQSSCRRYSRIFWSMSGGMLRPPKAIW